MVQPVVIVIGSGDYINDYFKFIKNNDESHRMLVVSRRRSPSTVPMGDSIFLNIPAENSHSFVVLYCMENNLSVIAVINRTDRYEQLHGQLVDTFDVAGPSSKAVLSLSDKVNMHRLMQQHDLDFFRARTLETTLEDAKIHMANLQFPAVLKTSVGANGSGVYKMTKLSDFKKVKESLIAKDREALKKIVLIEQFMYGKQVAPVMYVDKDGVARIITLVDIISARETKQKNMRLVYRSVPSRYPEYIRHKIEFVMQTLVDITGIHSTAIHPEFFVVGKQIYLIEVNVRVGGYRQQLMQEAYNIDLNAVTWELAMGLDVSIKVKGSSSCTVCEVWEDESGVINELKLPKNKRIISSVNLYNVGDTYIAPPQGFKPLAKFTVVDPDDSLSVAKKIRKNTKISIV